MLAEKAVKNGWNGIVVYGLIRDSVDIGQMDIGVKALGTLPLKSVKRGVGLRNEVVRFHDVTFTPGQYLYSDEDGMIVSPVPLLGE
jgi:regulator of ribonuclease activity A